MAVQDLTEFCGKPMSEAIHDMDAYIKLTDEVFYRILHSTGDKMKTVCNLVLIHYYTRLCNCCSFLLFLIIGS